MPQPIVNLVILQSEIAVRLAEKITGVPRPLGMPPDATLDLMPDAMREHFLGLGAVVMGYISEVYSGSGIEVCHVAERAQPVHGH